MSRGVRTARGTVAAIAATLIAAISHSAAGGSITPPAVIATAMLALPICVALAGRLGSLTRVSVAVILSQLPYHWTFWGLGLGDGPAASAQQLGHAAHLAAAFSPDAVASGAATGAMWLSHLGAAVLTIALLHHGEGAAIELLRLIRRALPRAVPAPSAIPHLATIRPRVDTSIPVATCAHLSTISHRGPPAQRALPL